MPDKDYNPFSVATSNAGSSVPELAQIGIPAAGAMAEQDPSVKQKAMDLVMDKGMNAGVDKGAGMLTKAIGGLGKKAATDVVSKHVAKNAIGTAAGKGGGMAAGATGAMTGIAAAAAPILPFVIGAMALKSIFKK